MPQLKLTADILSAALEGFEVQKNRIDARIAEIKQMLDGGGTQPTALSEAAKPKRRVSAAARLRMAKAQRLRWKKIKQAATSESTKPKRKMSAAGRKRIAAAQKKRWAAIKKHPREPLRAGRAANKRADEGYKPGASPANKVSSG